MTIDPDRLDDLLTREPYLDDGGFTAQVLERLPPRHRDLRPWVKGLSALAAGVTALLVLPGLVQAGLASLATVALPAAVAPGLVVGLAAAVGAAALVGLVLALER
jgi:hypothetical protein